MQVYPMPTLVRCPYCIEGNNFKVMMGKAEGRWFLCARCGHVAMPDDPGYQCMCLKCNDLRREPSSLTG